MRGGGLIGLAIGMASACGSGHAKQFGRVPIDGGVVVTATGPIVEGDRVRLAAFLNTLPATDRISGFAFDSPGGSVLEAERLAGGLRNVHANTIVTDDAKCVSACFLLFAAGINKFAGATALIGVHSASDNGQEDLGSMGVTTAMARDAANLGVPVSIIGKMVATGPGRVEWLLPDDLRAMGVVILKSKVAFAGPKPVPSTDTAALAPNIPLPGGSPAFKAGRADRQAWEAWVANLPADAYAGAQYWAASRSGAHPNGCDVALWQGVPLRTSGCLAAQRMLTPMDARRLSEPDYRRGWNSL